MAKLSTIPPGTVIKLKVMGDYHDFTVVGQNHYGKGETTLMFYGRDILREYMAVTTKDTVINSTGMASVGTEFPSIGYVGYPADLLLELELPKMLEDEIRGSMVYVPLDVYTLSDNFQMESSYSIVHSGQVFRYNVPEGADIYPYTNKATPGQMVNKTINRRAFLFSAREIGAPLTASVQREGVIAGWDWSSCTIYYGVYGSKFDYLNDNRSEIIEKYTNSSIQNINRFYWCLRGGAYMTGSFGGLNNFGDRTDAWAPFYNGLIAIPSYSPTPFAGDSGNMPYSVPSCIGYPFYPIRLSHAGISQVEIPVYVSVAGMCLDGNCEVSNTGSGYKVTKGTAVKSYRKIDGTWYRTV